MQQLPSFHSRESGLFRARIDEESARFGAYGTRILLSLSAALLLMLSLAHLPVSPPEGRIGWHTSTRSDDVALQQEQRKMLASAAPMTSFGKVVVEIENLVGVEPVHESTSEGADELPQPGPPAELSRLNAAVLDFSENMPEVKGGMGALYLHIEYPADAKEQGIEGRLILQFIVERDGRPTSVGVLKGLFPSCDSSAVRAVRETTFVPGTQEGRPVRVRMRLPVRFKLLNAAVAASAEPGVQRHPVP